MRFVASFMGDRVRSLRQRFPHPWVLLPFALMCVSLVKVGQQGTLSRLTDVQAMSMASFLLVMSAAACFMLYETLRETWRTLNIVSDLIETFLVISVTAVLVSVSFFAIFDPAFAKHTLWITRGLIGNLASLLHVGLPAPSVSPQALGTIGWPAMLLVSSVWIVYMLVTSRKTLSGMQLPSLRVGSAVGSVKRLATRRGKKSNPSTAQVRRPAAAAYSAPLHSQATRTTALDDDSDKGPTLVPASASSEGPTLQSRLDALRQG